MANVALVYFRSVFKMTAILKIDRVSSCTACSILMNDPNPTWSIRGSYHNIGVVLCMFLMNIESVLINRRIIVDDPV